MKFDLTKPVQTRDGRKARIICADRTNADGYSVVALLEGNVYGGESLLVYLPSGRVLPNIENNADLINIPETTYKYRVLYREGGVGVEQDSMGTPLHPLGIGWVRFTFIDGVVVDVDLMKQD